MKRFQSKQPWEELTYRFGFANALDLIEEEIGAIEEVVIVDAEDEAETDLSATMYDESSSSFSGNYAYIRVKGGTTGHRYKVSVRISSSFTAMKVELDAILPVREI